MKNRKLRFNAVDVLLILMIAAAAVVLLYVFVWSDRGSDNTDLQYTDIQYVVEVQNVESRFADSVKRGQSVEDAIARKSIGTVAGVEVVDFEKITFDYDNIREKVAGAADRITIRITVEAQAVETDRAFTVDGCEIRVGEQYSLMLPDFYAVGYCIELRDND